MRNTDKSQAARITPINALHNQKIALKQHLSITLLLIMMTALCLAACGRRNVSSDADTYMYDGIGPRPGGTSVGGSSVPDTNQVVPELQIDRSPFYGETLVIYALSRYSNNITAIANEYMRLNPGISIEIISFRSNLERAIQETSIALGSIATHAQASSTAPPVLIESALVNRRDTHLLANWVPFINATPSFNDYNFFMNAFNAMTKDDYLYEFPLAFSFNMVATNRDILGLTQAMNVDENGITMYRLLRLMRDFNTTGYHPNPYVPDLRMYLWHNFDVGHGFDYLHYSSCLETSAAGFNSQHFIDFLYHAREATHPDKIFGEDYAPPLRASVSLDWDFVIWRYFFLNIGVSDYHDIMHIPTETRDIIFRPASTIFTGAVPIVSNQGELIITPTTAYVLNAGATPVQQDLAWDFMQFMASEAGTKAASRSIFSHQSRGGIVRERLPMMPINRDAARFSIRENWPDSDMHRTRGTFCLLAVMLTGTRNSEVAIPLMDDWLDDIGNMPMVLAQIWPDTVRPILQDFHNGAISAAETAMLIQGLIEFEMAGME